jgi:hypothetical protein
VEKDETDRFNQGQASRQAGWDLGNRRDATEERARLTLEAGVRKLVIGDVKIS